MTQHQCPSSKGKVEPPSGPRHLARLNGRAAWRSTEEFVDAPDFREFLEREFPAGASELLSTSRRDFVKLMGASLALAGASTIPGCRRPDHKILTYSREVPEEVIPGKPLFYATAMPLPCGGAEGLLVETHEGRPTKVEGNPLHPNNRGRASAEALASVLGLYDPDRLVNPRYDNPARGRLNATWDDFRVWAERDLKAYDATRGDGVAFIAEPSEGPAWEHARALLRSRWPNAEWVAWSPAAVDEPMAGARIAFGEPLREVFFTERARVIVSLDRGLIEDEPGAIANSRGIASMRRPMTSHDEMSRIYVAESAFSTLGGLADHRVRLAPSRIAAFAVELARALLRHNPDLPGAARLRDALAGVGVPGGDDLHIPMASGESGSFFDALAADLLAPEHMGRSLIVAGATQPPAVHALTHALNAALGNIGTTVAYLPVSEERAAPAHDGIRRLTERMRSGSVTAVFCLNVNPVYDAPADLNFAEAYARVPARVCLSVGASETAAASTWSLNGAHYLETWGDAVAADGTVSAIQPMIAPLYEPSHSALEFLGLLATGEAVSGHDLVRAAWRERLGFAEGDARFETVWRRALHDGVLAGSAPSPVRPSVRFDAVAESLAGLDIPAPPTTASMELVFTLGAVGDGRHGNNGWLHEKGDPVTKVAWDNPAAVSPATAKALRLEPDPYTARQEPRARVATLSVGGRTITVPVWISPGMADGVVSLSFGYGREVCGLVGTGVGVNAYSVRQAGHGRVVRGATLTRTGDHFPISSTQNHWSLESRTAVAREIDLPIFRTRMAELEHAGKATVKDPFVTGMSSLGLAEKLGELSHTPPNLSLYENPYNQSRGNPDPRAVDPKTGRPPAYSTRPQWGMTIDLSTCTGCGACMIACQSENNIPVVGKKEVAKGREMHWIRVDRYFVGDDLNDPEEMIAQPVACVQCENAPCETVCPVNATVHDEEGLNVMAYNRCIGTRYCMNNCPYKARRFNFFDWAQSKFNGGLDPRYVPESMAKDSATRITFNQNFIPPRLRAKLDEISKMKQNPDVTVRGRGVMEKCTFCIQRINRARVEMKLQDLEHVPDGFFQVACQQACPSEAIVFGDILDPESAVSKNRTSHRGYLLLGYLNTRPRTSHMLRVRNPNPAIRAAVDRFHDHHHDTHDSHDTPGQGGAPGEPAHSWRHDPVRRTDDGGYAVSLRVLPISMGAPA